MKSTTSSAAHIDGGLAPDDFLEREAGGPHHTAILLADLGSAVEVARDNWGYDDSPEAVELVRLCADLDRYLTGLSMLPDGTLTRYRRCARCSGRGRIGLGQETWAEDPCKECEGRGAIHAEEADG